MTVYNTQKYLAKCLDSLVNQTLSNFEIIIFNDASTDNSIQIIETYVKKYPNLIKFIDSERNVKIGAARNAAIRIAEGEYIGFVDSDDWISNTMFEKLYMEAVSNNLDIAECNLKKVYEDSAHNSFVINEISYRSSKSPAICDYFIKPGYIVTKLFKTSFIKLHSIAFPEDIYYEDIPTLLQCFPYTPRIGYIDEILYYYLQRGDSITAYNEMNVIDRKHAAEFIITQYKQRGLFEKYYREIEYIISSFFYLRTLVTIPVQFTKYVKLTLTESREFILHHFPHYLENQYFLKAIGMNKRMLVILNAIDPYFLLAYKLIRRLF